MHSIIIIKFFVYVCFANVTDSNETQTYIKLKVSMVI